MNRAVTRRDMLLCSCSATLMLGCERLQALVSGDPSAEERVLSAEEIAREALKPAAGSFSGRLEARRFMSYAGCADQGTALRWLVLERAGVRFPLRLVTDATLAALARGDENALENDALHGDLLSPEDASRLGLAVGERVTLDGVCVALHFSGTLTLDPVFGLCTKQISRS
jgi:hypothetical protein